MRPPHTPVTDPVLDPDGPLSSGRRVGSALSPKLKGVEDLTLHDLEALRLILRGTSVIDWHRLNFASDESIARFVRTYELDLHSDDDQRFIEHVKRESISFLRRNFAFAIPKPVENATLAELLLMASGR